MTGRRAIIGLCLFCALIFSTVAAQGAHAHGITKGTTAFTCTSSAPMKTFSDAHCKTAGPPSNFGHVGIAQDITTEVLTTNITTGTERSLAVLESKQAGIAEQISAEVVEGNGWMENKSDTRQFVNGEGKIETEHEHYAHGEVKTLLKNVTVTKPAGKGCKVKGSQIETNQLTFSSTKEGDEIKFRPTVGTVIAEFEIEGCSTGALNGLYKIEGSWKAPLTGATVASSHASVTAQGTLLIREQVAGLSGSKTLSGRAKESGGPYTPLGFTTVEVANTT